MKVPYRQPAAHPLQPLLRCFLFWGIATGSNLLPFGLPGPFVGDTSFEYTATNAAGDTANATVYVRVHKADNKEAGKPDIAADTGTGFAKADTVIVPERRTKIIKVQNNDEGGKEDGYKVGRP
jgi:taurine transport system permease protein